MLCYLDRLFCTAYPKTCSNAGCERALTDEVREGARRWWGDQTDGPPIATSDLSLNCPDCIEVRYEQPSN